MLQKSQYASFGGDDANLAITSYHQQSVPLSFALLTFVNIEGIDAKAGSMVGLCVLFSKRLSNAAETVLLSRSKSGMPSSTFWLSVPKARYRIRTSSCASEVTLTFHPIGVSRHPGPMDATLFIRPSRLQLCSAKSSATRKSSPVNGSSSLQERRQGVR